jgi:hypothetical protein
MRRVIFYRDYVRFFGGHLKVFHYFNHLSGLDGFYPEIFFSQRSSLDQSNPWFGEKVSQDKDLSWKDGDVLFLAGADWNFFRDKIIPEHVPIINLIQGVRHADPSTPLFKFLPQKAIRICVSHQVCLALEKTGITNGHTFTIENGCDLPLANNSDQDSKSIDVLICAMKNKEMGRKVYRKTKDLASNVELLDQILPRDTFLTKIKDSRIAVFFPHPAEGFFLPDLEAMVSRSLAICPDCVGNRSFCIPDQTCLMPEYKADEIVLAIQKALSMNSLDLDSLLNSAQKNSQNYSLHKEQSSFLEIVKNLQNLWQ